MMETCELKVAPGWDRRLGDGQLSCHAETGIGANVMNTRVFWIFGILQCASLGVILFLILRLLDSLGGAGGIGLDTRILLSVMFPLCSLLVEYAIFAKR
jgi:hypothetical protein